MGLLGCEAFFIFGAVSNFYRYVILKIYVDVFLAGFSTAVTAILTVYLVVILLTYLDKRKVLRSFQQ